MRKIFADVTTKSVTVYSPGKGGVWETVFVPLPVGLFDDANSDVVLDLPKFKASTVVLVANLRKTVIRVADVPFGKHDRWDLASSAFPIGDKMNESNYVFDGSVFAGKSGESRFFMAALPAEISETFARIGDALVGSSYRIERIDTAEHILMRRYAPESRGTAMLILLPQGEGLRLLAIANGLPQAIHYISDHPDYREAEFLRCAQNITKAIFLYSELEHISKWRWIHDILETVNIEEKPWVII